MSECGQHLPSLRNETRERWKKSGGPSVVSLGCVPGGDAGRGASGRRPSADPNFPSCLFSLCSTPAFLHKGLRVLFSLLS